MSDSSPEPPPILDYAAPAAVQAKLDLEHRLEAKILVGAGPEDIRPYFRRDKAAVEFFCAVMDRKCGADREQGRCVDCGAEARELYVELAWWITLPARPLRFTLASRTRRWPLITRHPLCRNCAADWARRLRWDRPRTIAIRALSVVVWFIVVGLVIGWMERSLEQIASRDLQRAVRVTAFLGIVCIVTYLVNRISARLIARWRPAALDRLMPDGVQFRRYAGSASWSDAPTGATGIKGT